jgi:hypothetical protein
MRAQALWMTAHHVEGCYVDIKPECELTARRELKQHHISEWNENRSGIGAVTARYGNEVQAT